MSEFEFTGYGGGFVSYFRPPLPEPIQVEVPHQLDDAALAIMVDYCGGDPRTRGSVSVEVMSLDGSDKWSLDDFKKTLAEAEGKIPIELIESGAVELEWSEYGAYLKLRFIRPETDAEIAARVKQAYNYAINKQAAERAEYDRLRAKFSDL